MKEQFKAPEKIQLSNKEIAKLSDAQFKTLVIKMLQELTGYFNSIKKTQAAKMVTLCEIKKIYREPTVAGRKPGLTSTVWILRKKETSNQKRLKKQEFRKMWRGLRTSGTS